MRFVYHHKIGTRLGLGFALVAGLTILLGVIALVEMHFMADVTRDLYNHPMIVSNAIRDIRGNILAMHRSMKDMVLARNDQQLQEAVNQINQEQQAALQSFDVLYDRFLGEKADVDAARKAFLDWRPVREEIVNLMQGGSKEQAVQVTQGKGAEQALHINSCLQVVSDFARQKAATLFDRAQKTERLHIWAMSAMVVLISAAGIGGGFLITRSITGPLGYVVEQIGKVAGGNLDHKINLNSDDEIGLLARAFDDMTGSLKKITASRNEFDAANQQLRAHEQQLKAANQQLRAHEQQLRAANQQLCASEQHRENIISTMPGVVYQLQMDADGVFSIPYISRQAESIIGHPLSILTNSDCFFDIIHSEDVDNVRLSIRNSAQTLEPCTFEFRVFDTNGRLKWLKGVSKPRRFSDQSTIWSGIIIDITDHKQDEARLLESEERYRIVADNTYGWEFWIDSDDRYVYISPSCRRITGYTVEEFKTDPGLLRAIIHPDDRQLFQTHSIHIRTDNAAERLEFRIINKDQQVRWIEQICQPLFDKDGKRLGIRGSNRDITVRKQAEEALRQNETFIKLVMDNLPIGIAVNSVNPDVKFSYMNDNFPKLYRTTREALAGPNSFWDSVYEEPGFREEIKKRVLEDCASGDPKRMIWADVPITRKGSETTFITAMNTSIPGRQMLISTVWDVTDRKRAEDTVLVSEARYRRLFEAAHDGILILDADSGQIVDVNPFIKDMLGYSHEEFLNKKLWEIGLFKNIAASKEAFLELQNKGYVRYENLPLETKDGRRIAVEFVSNVYMVDHTKVIQCNIRDITKRVQAEEALCHEQELTSRIMETSPVGVVAVNRLGEITFANACAEKLFGLSRDEVTKRAYNTLDWHITDYDGNPLPDEKLPFWQVMTSGKPVYDVHHAIQRPDGQRLLLSINAAPAFSEAGKFGGMVATIEDVTESIRDQKALKESEARFRTLFNAMSEGVALHELITDKDGKAIDYRIVDINPAYVVHTGLKLSEARNQLASELYKTGSPPYLDLFAHVAQTGAPMYFETYFPQMQKYFDISVFSPKPGWFATVFSDITLRRKTQQELRKSEEKFMKAFHGSPTLMAIMTIEEGRFIEVNDASLETLGYERQDVIGKTSQELQLYADTGQRDSIIQVLKEKGFVRNLEVQLRDRSGRIHDSLFSAEIIELQNTRYMLTIINDITERKKSEEVMQLHQANMSHLLRLGELGEMASGLAHEINQPLCAIENYAQACLRLMETKPDSTRLVDAIKDIRNQAERAGKIVHRVKGLVRKKPPHFEFTGIKDIIQEAIDLMGAEAKTSGIQIGLHIPEDIPPAYADFVLIEQVVINLIRNGFEAMNSPEIHKKELTITARAGSNTLMEVSISDTGCGISQENMDKIFGSFFTTKSDGLGIGLSLSKAIVESHSGQIWVTSNTDGGVTFHFTLPTRNHTDEA